MTREQHPVMVRWQAHLDSKADGFVVRDEAEAFIAHERSDHAAELADWLSQQAVRLLAVHAQTRTLKHQRMRAASTFRRAATEPDPADDDFDDVRSPFMALYVTNEHNFRKRLGDMVAKDHMFVADKYRLEGKRAMLKDAFHRAVAKRLGDKTTAEVFDVEQYGQLLVAVENGHRPPELFAATEAA